ncbi:MAG: DNA recombination protein RmuC [Candidatus Omnitrophota bacterium]
MQFLFLNIITLIAAVVILYLLFQHLKNQLRQEHKTNTDSLEQRFNNKLNESKSDLELRKQAVESSVGGLKEELEKYKKLMREFEEDRTRKYGNLETELKKTSVETNKLQETTAHLSNVLGNVKLRGQWGERMAEDIIKGCGLIEGKNYKKQTKQTSAGTRPDYTFLLPDKHKINMDVKFPLDNYLQMVNASDSAQKDRFKKEFLSNVNDRIKEIQNREYINLTDNTLDFVLLFIPNEQVYGFIQENVPGLIDNAMKQKVVLCSPFTLYAMLSVIRQAFENFYYEKATKNIVNVIDQFSKAYDKFKDRFERELGTSINKLESQYRDITEKSFKSLDTKIRRIYDYKKGRTPILEDDSQDIIEISHEEPENKIPEWKENDN